MLGFAREGYEKFSFRPKDVIDYMAFPGFWQVIGTHFAAAVEEMRNSFWKQGYLAQCRKYCPSLSLADLEPGVAGIRAQAVLRDGTLVHDFLFAETARMLHVCNAPSPAATSAIPIARMIAEKVLARFSAIVNCAIGKAASVSVQPAACGEPITGRKCTDVWDRPVGGSLDLGNCDPWGAGSRPRTPASWI